MFFGLTQAFACGISSVHNERGAIVNLARMFARSLFSSRFDYFASLFASKAEVQQIQIVAAIVSKLAV